ncbi:MAG TPA: oligopeptide:H+ symporter [Caulobacteraceae bacterium]|nr:oligopeptide:H+ symporter [Caulobacteraceae bacterium]
MRIDIVFLIGALITALSAIPIVVQLRRHHPKGLVILFFAEMWERFSYYGMRGLLIFYLTQHFLFDDKTAAGRYSSYTTMVALLPIGAAVIVDRWLGTRKAVAFGALLLVCGHLTMALEGPPAQQQLTWHGQTYAFQLQGRAAARDVKLLVAGKPYAYHSTPDGGLTVEGLPPGSPLPAKLEKKDFRIDVVSRSQLAENTLFLALSLIVVGVSFLKTSPLVAQLYPREDPRRDGGFTIFYYGVNLGAFWAGVVCGYLGQNVGWWAGFGLAAIGMSLGFIVFVLGKPLLQGKGEPPDPVRLAKPVAGPINGEWLIYLGGLTIVGAVWLFLYGSAALGPTMIGLLLSAVTLSAVGYLAVYMVTKCNTQERLRIGLAFILMLGFIVFWTLFEQAGSSLNLFAERNTDLNVVSSPVTFAFLGHQVFLGSQAMVEAAGLMHQPGVWWIDTGLAAPQTQSFNPGFILMFAPMFAALWAWLGRRNADPPVMVKFGLALLQVGGGFMLLVFGARFVDPAFRTPLYFLLGAYLLHTTGELCLSPVGLSVVSRLAPPALVATLLSMLSLSTSWSQFIGGFIAKLAATDTVGGQVLDPGKALATAVHVFTWIGLVGMGFGVVFLAISPLVRAWDVRTNPDAAPEEPAQEAQPVLTAGG